MYLLLYFSAFHLVWKKWKEVSMFLTNYSEWFTDPYFLNFGWGTLWPLKEFINWNKLVNSWNTNLRNSNRNNQIPTRVGWLVWRVVRKFISYFMSPICLTIKDINHKIINKYWTIKSCFLNKSLIQIKVID